MSENQRKYPRYEVRVDVQLSFLDNEPRAVCTKDISECGMFLDIDNPSDYPLGEMLHLSYKNPLRDNLDTEIDGIIVRITDDGLGVAFVDLDAF